MKMAQLLQIKVQVPGIRATVRVLGDCADVILT